ncbi:MAG: hypothetical protein ACE5J1_03100, partial [Nitrospiria bacterium]
IGKVWDHNIDDPYLVKETIESDAFLSRLIKVLNLPTTPQKIGKALSTKVVETKKKEAILLEIQGHSSDPRQAVEIVDTTARLLIEDHRQRFEEGLNEHKSYETKLEKDVARIEAAVDELGRLIKGQQMNPTVNAPSVILLQGRLGEKNAQLIEIRRELRDTRINNRSSIVTENTRLISPPVLPKDPVNPRVMLMMALAGMVGLFAALILAFFLEYLAQVRIRETKLAGQGQNGEGKGPAVAPIGR